MSLKQMINGQLVNIAGGSPTTASSVAYDNTTSGLEAENTQDAIDEIKSALSDKADKSYVTANVFGTAITIGTSFYTTTKDGYLELNSGNGSGAVYIKDSNGVSLQYVNRNTPNGAQIDILFIRKGLQLQCTTGTATFYPLNS